MDTMRSLRKFIFLFLLLCMAIAGFSQTQTIRGCITDKVTKYPLIGANIVVLNSSPLLGTATDTSGNFKLSDVPVGFISLKISYMGYSDIILTNLELLHHKELVINAGMEEKVFTGKEVVISAGNNGITPLNKMAAVSIRSFTIEETSLFAGTRCDVSRMASNYAGVRSGDDARNDIVIRGNTPTGLLWTFDDVEIPNPNHFAAFGTSGGPISILRNNLLQNSDFLTGAFPAEYGNAIAGVFDLKSANGNTEKHDISILMGFDGASVAAEGPVNRAKGSSYMTSYRISFLELFSLLGVKFGTGIGVPKYQDIYFKVNLPKTKIGNLSVFGYGGISNIAFNDSERDTTKNIRDLYGTRGWDINNHSAQAVIGISDYFLLSKSSYFKFSLATTYHNFYFYKDSVTPVSLEKFRYEFNNDMECKLFGNISFTHKFNARHHLKTGIKASLIYFNIIDSLYHAQKYMFIKRNDFCGYSALLQAYIDWQYRVSEFFTMTLGAHGLYYFYNQSWALEPRLGLKWNVAPLHSLSLGFGMHSQQIPSTIFFMQELQDDGSYQFSNHNLGFSKSIHLALAYDWIISENTRLKAEVYYQYLYDIPIDTSNGSSYSLLNEGASFDVLAPDNLNNLGIGHNYGVEVTAERFFSKGFYYLGTASYGVSKYSGADKILRSTAFNSGYNINLLGGKEFKFKTKKNKPVKKSRSIILNIKTTLSSGRHYTPINERQSYIEQKIIYYNDRAYSSQLPVYSRTDLKISYRMTAKKISFEVGLEIANLFNQKNILNISFDKNSGKLYKVYQLGIMLIPQFKLTF